MKLSLGSTGRTQFAVNLTTFVDHLSPRRGLLMHVISSGTTPPRLRCPGFFNGVIVVTFFPEKITLLEADWMIFLSSWNTGENSIEIFHEKSE